MRKLMMTASLLASLTLPAISHAADYLVDVEGSHAFINFKIKHLGYSWLYGRFNKFDGNFSYDAEKPEASKIEINVDTASIDSNHAERDKHLRGEEFLDTDKYPKAKFTSTGYKAIDDQTGVLTGTFEFHGVKKPIEIKVEKIGEGADPWGGYRAGFKGTTEFKLADYGITYNLGPASTHVQLELSIEGIRQ